jgi:hypothetical protein
VGYFDTIEDMHAVAEEHKGATKLSIGDDAWTLE